MLMKLFASGLPVKFKETIESNSKEITRLRDRATQAGTDRDVSPEHREKWQSAWDEFGEKYDALAFLGGESTARQRMRSGDVDAIEYALCFIEIRPYFFRSGYMYNHFLRILRNCDLTPLQRQRYQKVYDAYRAYKGLG